MSAKHLTDGHRENLVLRFHQKQIKIDLIQGFMLGEFEPGWGFKNDRHETYFG